MSLALQLTSALLRGVLWTSSESLSETARGSGATRALYAAVANVKFMFTASIRVIRAILPECKKTFEVSYRKLPRNAALKNVHAVEWPTLENSRSNHSADPATCYRSSNLFVPDQGCLYLMRLGAPPRSLCTLREFTAMFIPRRCPPVYKASHQATNTSIVFAIWW